MRTMFTVLLLLVAPFAQAANETAIFNCLEGLQGILKPEDLNVRRIETPTGVQYLVRNPPHYILFDGKGHRFVDTSKLDPAFRTEIDGAGGTKIPELRLAIPGVRGTGPVGDKDYQPLIVREGRVEKNGKIMSWLSGEYGVDGSSWSLRMPKSEPLPKSVWMAKTAVSFKNDKFIVLDGSDPAVFDKGVKSKMFNAVLDRIYRSAVEALELKPADAKAASLKMQKAKIQCAVYFEQEVQAARVTDRGLEDLTFAMDKVIYSPNSGITQPIAKPADTKKPEDGIQ